MIRRVLPVRRWEAILGWIRWTLLLIPPALALAFDTWLNTEMLRNDYEIALINVRIKSLSDTLDELRVEEARLQTFDRIEIEAPDLGLIDPQPDQIQIIHCTDEELGAIEEPYSLAGPLDRPETDHRIASLPFRLPGSEGVRWEDTESFTTRMSATPMGDLLRKAIYSACASSPGDF